MLDQELIERMSISQTVPSYTEPWLSGTYAKIPTVGRAVLHALDLSLDDLTKWTGGLTDAEVHAEPLGLTSVAFHLRHIAPCPILSLSF